jgi:hypothetical protein
MNLPYISTRSIFSRNESSAQYLSNGALIEDDHRLVLYRFPTGPAIVQVSLDLGLCIILAWVGRSTRARQSGEDSGGSMISNPGPQ